MASRKNFQDFADGLVSRFVGRNNDIDRLWGIGVLAADIHESGQSFRVFDLLDLRHRLDGGSARWLRHRMDVTNTPHAWLVNATLCVAYAPDSPDRPEERIWTRIFARPVKQTYCVVATVTLVDDRGRSRSATAQTWCWDQTLAG